MYYVDCRLLLKLLLYEKNIIKYFHTKSQVGLHLHKQLYIVPIYKSLPNIFIFSAESLTMQKEKDNNEC